MHAKKRALGRGLDALLGAEEPSAPPTAADRAMVRMLPVGMLHPNPFQPRKHFNPEGLEELKASITEKGILQPLIVRQNGNVYEIVAGERRWRASQQAGLTEVPAIVRAYEDQDMLELALIENLQREELNPVEEARAYQQLIEQFELTQNAVAERVGKSRVAVTNALRLLGLPDAMLPWIEEGKLSAGHARAILGIENDRDRLGLAREVIAKGLSVRELERKVKRLQKAATGGTGKRAAEIDRLPDADHWEEKLSLYLGLKTRILPKSNKTGKIEVFYGSLDEFQHFFEQIGLSLEQEL